MWVHYFPRIIPYFAIKSNPNLLTIKMLAKFGIGFDCASKAEIEKVLNCNVSPDRIIFANPCKFNDHIEYANKKKVLKMTFDSADELYKIKKYFPQAQVVVRMFVETSTARCPVI